MKTAIAAATFLIGDGVYAHGTRVTTNSHDLVQGFQQPPESARPQVWWHWMNGNISKSGITKDLEAISANGLGGVTLFEEADRIPEGSVAYASPEHFELIKFAADECDRLGLEFSFHNCPGWSSSGGPWITADQAMKHLTWSQLDVEGTGRRTLTLPRPSTHVNPYNLPSYRYAPQDDYYRDIVVVAIPKVENPEWRLEDWQGQAGFLSRYHVRPSGETAPPGAILGEDEIRILKQGVDGKGNVTWDVPAGEWTLLRFGYTLTGILNQQGPTNGGKGLDCDKLSREAVDFHWKHFVSRVVSAAREDGATSLQTVLIDSYETESQTWTPRMAEDFKRLRGYDLLPWLPCLTGRVIGSVALTERFLRDYRRTIADLVQENYYGHFAEKCREKGLRLAVEGYGFNGIFDDFAVARLAAIPMGEFWAGIYKYSQWSSKVAASASDINGAHLVGVEAFTSGGMSAAWRWHPYTLKAQGDYFLCRGATRFYFQASAHQPWADNVKPGMTMGPHGIQMNRNNTWWKQSRGWLEHLSRTQYLLQKGQLVTDVCYYLGENAPTTLRLKPQGSRDRLGQPWDIDADMRPDLWLELPTGRDFHVVNEDVLAEMRVDDQGRIEIPGRASYRVLVLPDDNRMRPGTLRLIAKLIEQGGTVVGPRPVEAPGLEDGRTEDATVRTLANRVWGEIDGSNVTSSFHGKGRIYYGKSLADIFAEHGTPKDFAYAGKGDDTRPMLDYMHRRIEGDDFYFVSNQRNETAAVEVTFRVGNGLIPEIWNTETGQVSEAMFWRRTEDDRTIVDLNFTPAQSVFVVFRKYGTVPSHPAFTNITHGGRQLADAGLAAVVAGRAAPELHAFARGDYVVTDQAGNRFEHRVGDLPTEQDLSESWSVSFPTAGRPMEREFSKLHSWTQSSIDGVRYFSGTATYTRDFNLDANRLVSGALVELDLGEVSVIAEVILNGKNLGVWWKPPYRGDITTGLRPGLNHLMVKVTNLWPNRLIGDARQAQVSSKSVAAASRRMQYAQPPRWVSEGLDSPQGVNTYTTMPIYSEEAELLMSGLIGPVALRFGVRLPLLKPTEFVSQGEARGNTDGFHAKPTQL